MLPGEYAVHTTPLSYKLEFKSSIFFLSPLFLEAINVASWYLTFLPGADIWLRSHYCQPSLLLRQTIPIDRYGPCEAFYLEPIQDLTWPLNQRSTAVKCLSCHSPPRWRRTGSSQDITHTQWHTHFHHICCMELRYSFTTNSKFIVCGFPIEKY